jgi:Restriction endonuclease
MGDFTTLLEAIAKGQRCSGSTLPRRGYRVFSFWIDGILFFRSDKDKTEKALVSVKGGENVGVGMVRDLIAVVEREKAGVGVLISLALPTRAMEREAAAAGLFEGPFESVPKIQIITLAELFQGIRPRIPRIDAAATFRTAARESANTQGRLL